jgi:hypothetical protein
MTGRQTPRNHVVEVPLRLLVLRAEVEKLAQPFLATRRLGAVDDGPPIDLKGAAAAEVLEALERTRWS